MKVTTKSGETYTIPDGLHSDFRFVKAWRDMRSPDKEKAMNAAIELVDVVFSDEAEEQRFLRSVDPGTGRAPISAVYARLNEILVAAGEADKDVKNS